MIWSKKLALCLAPIQGTPAGSAKAKQFAPGDGSDLDGGAPPVAAPCLMLRVQPGC
ncbi:MAG: hypothetical protein NDI91_00995 [Sulfuritalea sp.]|nr:hypothetical protein [Sulfuritalea sp.]